MTAPALVRERRSAALRTLLAREAVATAGLRHTRRKIGAQLRVARLACGLSLRAAAPLGGCAFSMVHHLETGRQWSAPIAQRLAAAYAERER